MDLARRRYQEPTRFFATLKSLNEFDKVEIRKKIQGVLSPTEREICFIGNYYRGAANIESIVALNQLTHLQAIAAVARGLFEMAVDVALINRLPQSIEKMLALIEVEKLRSAEAVIAFKTANPSAQVDIGTFEQFVKMEGPRIIARREFLWPKSPDVQHWSLLKLQKRAEMLGEPFHEIYAVEYPRLSWYIHSGLTGVANLSAASLDLMAGIAFTIAMKSYMEIMTAIIHEFKLDKADPKIKNRMLYAKMLPWTDDEQQQSQLRLELHLD